MSAQDIKEFSLLEVNNRGWHSQTHDWQNIQAKGIYAAGGEDRSMSFWENTRKGWEWEGRKQPFSSNA